MSKIREFPAGEPPRRKLRITSVETLMDKSLLGRVVEERSERRFGPGGDLVPVGWIDEQGRRCHTFVPEWDLEAVDESA